MSPPGSHHRKSMKPQGGHRGASCAAMFNSLRSMYGRKSVSGVPDNWRDRLPDPATYYGLHVAKLGQPKSNGYAVGLCPFHDDHSPSFGVKLTDLRGPWCCYAGCGKGDMVAFHQRLSGLDFKATVLDLIECSR